MTPKADYIYKTIQNGFEYIIRKYSLNAFKVSIKSRGLSPEEAIGNTKRRDYPILTGKEVMLQADCKGALGQAFSEAPSDFNGSLQEIMEMSLSDPHARGLYFASMNAVMNHLGLIKHTVHCRTHELIECADCCLDFLKKEYAGQKIALIGYQPSMFEVLSENFPLRVLDLNPVNVGQKRFGIVVEHGIDDYEKVVLDWADLVLCTGSVFSNATMDKYIDIGKKVIFFGITASGAGHILKLNRFCPLSL